MEKVTVIGHRCPQNHPCPSVTICPTGAIQQKGFGLPVIIEEKCTGCMRCTKFCPLGAIRKKEKTA